MSSVQGLGGADAKGHSDQKNDGEAAAASSFDDYPYNPVVLGASAPSHQAGHRPPAVNLALATRGGRTAGVCEHGDGDCDPGRRSLSGAVGYDPLAS